MVRLACAIVAALGLVPAALPAVQLHDAVRDGDRAVIELLLANEKTDVNTRDAQGGTALHWAAFHGDRALVERLLARGAEVDVSVSNGNTPLHQAAYAGHERIVAMLLAAGANVQARNDQGFTPLHWAARNGHGDVAIALIRAGAARDATAADGTTPRTLALGQGHRAVARSMDMASTSQPAPAPVARAAMPAPRSQPRATPSPPAVGDEAGRYRVQLAASGNERAARRAWTKLQRDHAELLGALDLFLDRVPRNGGRLWYRVRTEPLGRQQATRLCTELKRRRVDCLVSRRH